MVLVREPKQMKNSKLIFLGFSTSFCYRKFVRQALCLLFFVAVATPAHASFTHTYIYMHIYNIYMHIYLFIYILYDYMCVYMSRYVSICFSF